MADLIIDPDFLSQGNTSAWSTTNPGQSNIPLKFTNSGVNIGSIANGSVATIPSFDEKDHFEVRGATSANNNGLYSVTTVTLDQQNYVVAKVAGSVGSMTTAALDTSGFILGSDAVAGNNTPGTSLSAAATGKSVYFDTYNKKLWLIRQGNLGDAGVTLQALYSFTKEEWKNDPYLIQFDFPFTAVTPEQFETSQAWRFYDTAVDSSEVLSGVRFPRDLIRTGGWSEFNENDTTELIQQYAGVITLGTFEDNAEDLAYVQYGTDPTDTTAKDAFVFNGPINEAVRVYDIATANDTSSTSDGSTGDVTNFDFATNSITRTGGNWFTDGFNVGGGVDVVSAGSNDNENLGTTAITALTSTILTVGSSPYTANAADTYARVAYDNRSAINLFLRGNTAPGSTSQSKSYNASDLGSIGVTTVQNQVYRFPLTNSLDAKIATTDTDITGISPYTEIRINYFPSAGFNIDVDTTGTPRTFGIVVDAGTWSGIDGATSGAGSALTTATAGIPGTTYDGGTLTIHEGNDKGDYPIVTATGGTVNITGTFPTGDTLKSFTLQRAVPLNPTIEQIYNKVQYQLRLDSNINETNGGGVVTGSTADELLAFVGDAITAGSATSPPENPEGGGTGVTIVGFNVNDTNDTTFVDNSNLPRNFPFLASGDITFNNNLDADTDSAFWMFYDYTHRRSLVNATVTPTTGFSATIGCDAGTALTAFNQVTPGATGPTSTQLTDDDYVRVSGFANVENNGIWRVTGRTDTSLTAVKVDGDTPVTEAAVASGVTVDEDPLDTPDAIIVNDNSAVAIGNKTVDASVSFDYDFTNNNQGSRIASTNALYGTGGNPGNNAAVVIRAIGLSGSQFTEVASTITRASGQSISVVGGQERNYSNPV
jgi:hypothetical protein